MDEEEIEAPRRGRPPKPKTVTVECIVPNVHLGDERSLDHGEQADVTEDIADLLEANGQVKRV